MSADQIQKMLAEDIKEIKNTLKELNTLLTNLRVELAEDYIRKSDYNEEIRNLEKKINKTEEEVSNVEKRCIDKIEEHKKEERNFNLKALSIGLTASGTLFYIIQWVYNLAKGN